MKSISFFIPLLLTLSFSSIAAGSLPALSDFISSNDTKATWHKLVSAATLPDWVKKGGTDGATYDVSLGGEKYIVMSACKPHDCAAESIAVLYSSRKKEAYALYASVDEKSGNETLTWINLPDGEMPDARTVLFAKITGSLDNHPESFNFK